MVCAAALVCAGGSSAASSRSAAAQELTITVSGGVQLACGLVLPLGSAPAGGWPGLLLFHGLGQSHTTMEQIALAAFAPAGFASLACDAPGTGASGGTFGLDGPADVQDARDLFDWLAARPDVSDTQIGAFGLSLGGGLVWNAAAAGVPFKAIVPAITWTDLSSALAPDGIPKSGSIAQLAQVIPFSSWDPSLTQARTDLLAGNVTSAVTAVAAARSVHPKLHSLTVPTLLLQGRHDFLFDIDQARAAYNLLAGPKRLYLGDLGHPPAANPADEESTYLGEAVAWFGHYLAGGPAVPVGVELAHDPWNGTTTTFTALPTSRLASVSLPGTTTLKPSGFAVRSARLTGGPFQTFGDGYIRVRYSGASKWSRLVASVSIKGHSAPITEGAAPISAAAGVVKIPLMDECVPLPRGKALVVTIGATSKDRVFATAAPSGASIKIGRVTATLSLLKSR
jgi:pimeloyl-ACP methyl ester carboxylesterase